MEPLELFDQIDHLQMQLQARRQDRERKLSELRRIELDTERIRCKLVDALGKMNTNGNADSNLNVAVTTAI